MKVFLEGLRSRGRRQLRLRTGLLKALRDIAQRTVALVPLAMSYELLPDDDAKLKNKNRKRECMQGYKCWMPLESASQLCFLPSTHPSIPPAIHASEIWQQLLAWTSLYNITSQLTKSGSDTSKWRNEESLYKEMCGLPRDPLRTADLLFWVLRGIRGELPPIGEAFMRQGCVTGFWHLPTRIWITYRH